GLTDASRFSRITVPAGTPGRSMTGRKPSLAVPAAWRSRPARLPSFVGAGMLRSDRWARLLGVGCLLGCLCAAGCRFGAKMLEHSYGPYNDAVKQVAEEQLLTNIVRLRYN